MLGNHRTPHFSWSMLLSLKGKAQLRSRSAATKLAGPKTTAVLQQPRTPWLRLAQRTRAAALALLFLSRLSRQLLLLNLPPSLDTSGWLIITQQLQLSNTRLIVALEQLRKENIYPTVATHKWLYTVLVKTARYFNRNKAVPFERSSWLLLEELYLCYKPV